MIAYCTGLEWLTFGEAMGADLVRSERRGQVLVLTIDRPAVRNAFDLATALALEKCADDFEADPELRAAVLTGGVDVFSAGVDLKAAASNERPRTDRRGWFGFIESPPQKPVIAAVEGPALAGGCELALACDLIVASQSSSFGLPEVRRGLIASAGGLIRLPRRLPRAVAAEMALTGDPQPAERMFALGLVNRICPPGTSLAHALELAERIAANAPVSVRATKRILAITETLPEQRAWKEQLAEIERVRASEDYREGLAAFREKRPPRWKGR
jgi:acetyl-CoA C-acetyltransferase